MLKDINDVAAGFQKLNFFDISGNFNSAENIFNLLESLGYYQNDIQQAYQGYLYIIFNVLIQG